MRALHSDSLKPWEIPWNGRHWYEMPGRDEVDQKCNLALYRRGKLALEEEDADRQAAADEAQYVTAPDGAAVPARPGKVKVRTGHRRPYGIIVAAARGEQRRRREREEAVKRAARDVERALKNKRVSLLRARLVTLRDGQRGINRRVADLTGLNPARVSAFAAEKEALGADYLAKLEVALGRIEQEPALGLPPPRKVKALPLGYVPLKQWIAEQAVLRGIAPHSMRVWLMRNPDPTLEVLKLNARAHFVKVNAGDVPR